MNCVEKYSLTLNKNKCLYSLTSIDLLGYTISKGSVKPDPDRLKGLMNLPVPQNFPSLRRALGMFSHYSRWIFSEKLHPLTRVTCYPFTKEQTEAFKCLKQEIAKSSLVAIDSSLLFEIETGAICCGWRILLFSFRFPLCRCGFCDRLKTSNESIFYFWKSFFCALRSRNSLHVRWTKRILTLSRHRYQSNNCF